MVSFKHPPPVVCTLIALVRFVGELTEPRFLGPRGRSERVVMGDGDCSSEWLQETPFETDAG